MLEPKAESRVVCTDGEVQEVRPIFWVGIDDSISDFVKYNKPLQAISERYQLYMVCSGGISNKVRKWYHNPIVLECQNSRPMKGRVLFESIKKHGGYDVLIRTCPDALIFNCNMLFDIVRRYMQPHSVMGNLSRNKGRTWIRGACSVTSRSVVDAIEMKWNKGEKSFDQPFFRAAMEVGATAIDKKLFEIGDEYTGTVPVWHPRQLKRLHLRFKRFYDQVKSNAKA